MIAMGALGVVQHGIPAAVEVAGPRFLPVMIQLLLFGAGAFGGGLYFGRFWLARIVEAKSAEVTSKNAEIAAVRAAMEERQLFADRL
ncbi:MAG: hypothetical protein AAF830_16090 [Pseudomonadota bacterium]